MRKSTKSRIYGLLGGVFLIGIGAGEWFLVAQEHIQVVWFFYLTHIGAIVLGILCLFLAIRPAKGTVRFCPTCGKSTEQSVSKTKYSEKSREWTCDICNNKNTEPM